MDKKFELCWKISQRFKAWRPCKGSTRWNEQDLESRLRLNWITAYRVGSANFLQRKIGHAHDNSADSENVAGAPQRTGVCTRISFFVSKKVREIRAFFLSTTKIQLKRVNHKLSRRTIGAPWAGRVRQASSGPWKSLIQHRLVEKKKQANFVNRRKPLLKGYNFKESKHDRFGQRPAANTAEKIDERSTEADMCAFRRSIGLFFFFFVRSSKNFRFAFLALNVSSQYFTWKISICSAKSNHVLRCSLSGELATGRACLRTGDRVAASQLQLT